MMSILYAVGIISMFVVPALMWWEHLQWMKNAKKELEEKIRQNAVQREKMKDFKW